MKRFLPFITLFFLLVLTIIFIIMGHGYSEDVVLKGYKINISSSDSLKYVTHQKVEEWLYSENCVAYVGEDMQDINVRAIEQFLMAQSFISRVNVTKDIFGTLFVDIEQSEPAFRVFDSLGRDFYVDKNRKSHVYDGDFVLDIPVITCDTLLSEEIKNYSENSKKTEKNYNNLDKFFNFVNLVGEDVFWNSQIAGINIESTGKVEIYPRIGDHKIILCDFDDIGSFDEYFKKLSVFYDKQMGKSGWNTYSLIDLSFQDMIVCKLRKK